MAVMQKSKWDGIVVKAIKKEREACGSIDFLEGKPFVHFSWIFSNPRRDRDNIEAGRKFILDGMILSGLIKDDSFASLSAVTSDFALGSDCVLVTVSERPIVEQKFVDYGDMPEEYEGLVL